CESRMVASTATGDDNFVRKFRAFSWSSDFAISNSEASGFEEAQSSLFSSNVFFWLGHFSGEDGVAINVHGECNCIAFISRLGCSPGGVGDWVVDNGSAFTIIAVNSNIAVDGKNGGKCAAQVLGS